MSKIRKNYTILIVDNQKTTSLELRSFLCNSGYNAQPVSLIENNEIFQILEYQPDIILFALDNTANATNLTIAGLIKKNTNIPFIFLCNEIDQTIKHKLVRTKPRCILMQPVNLTELEINVETIISEYYKCKPRQHKNSQLPDNEELYRTLFKLSPDSIVIHNDGKITFCNSLALEKFGCKSLNDLSQKILFDFIPISSRENVRFKVTLEESKRYHLESFEAKLISNRSEIFDIEAHTTSIIFNNKLSSIIIFRDITERKKNQEEFEQNVQKERELSLLKTQFISTVSHEFKMPISNLVLGTGMLRRSIDKADNQSIETYLTRINTAVRQLHNLYENISLINKNVLGVLTFNPVVVEFDLFVNELLNDAKVFYGNDIELDYTVDENIRLIKIDIILFRYIILNLLSNAVKYSDKGEKVNFSIKCIDNNIQLKFQDYGIGIPSDELNRIGQPFFRASNVDKARGTGLGLSIVFKSIELHGGKIVINSVMGEGTTVEVVIPYEKTTD